LVEAFQIHAILQTAAFLLFASAVLFARRHRMKSHHRLVYTGISVHTIAVALMIYEARGLPSLHGQLGFIVYLFMVFTTLSGRLILKRRVKRTQHRALSYVALVAMFSMILHGVFSFLI
jgi:hypothetical protein